MSSPVQPSWVPVQSWTNNGPSSPHASPKGENQPNVLTLSTDDPAQPCHHWQGQLKGLLQMAFSENIRFRFVLLWTIPWSGSFWIPDWFLQAYFKLESSWGSEHHRLRIAIGQLRDDACPISFTILLCLWNSLHIPTCPDKWLKVAQLWTHVYLWKSAGCVLRDFR